MIALRHVAFEDLWFLSPILAEAGWTVAYLDAPIADLDRNRSGLNREKGFRRELVM